MLDITESNITYLGGENQSVFPIPFPFLASAHIRARITDADGKSRALVAGTEYAINMISDENGELILLNDALAPGWSLTVTRLVPITQDVLFHNQGPNSPGAIELAADKLTMIAQQLDERINGCLAAPEGVSAEDLSEELVNSAEKILQLRQEIAEAKKDIAAKADKGHGHVLSDVEALQQGLAGKVDTDAFSLALSKKADISSLLEKADVSQLELKADSVHAHSLDEVNGLVTALENKLDADDPRLDGLAKPASHAETHFLNGEDRIRPEDIGSLSAPPADGKSYLAAAGGWVEYIPSSGGGEGGEGEAGSGTMDHSLLLNRSAADQHPQSAIQYLSDDLAAIRADQDTLAETDVVLSARLAGKAEKAELPGPASAERDGLLSAADKVKIDGMDSLPSGGGDGDFLQRTAGGSGWVTTATAANSLPLMSSTQKGVARLATSAGLELDAGGALGIKAENLISKTNVESRLAGHDTRIGTLENSVTGLNGLPSTVSILQNAVDTSTSQLASVQATITTLGPMAFSNDAPGGGKTYLRKNGAWEEHTESAAGSGGGSAIIGEIRLLPFRTADLPVGWYLCNGDQFSLSSNQGEALYTLPVLMKSDWGIVVNGANINLPNLFSGTDGYFFRPVNNSSRQPGNTQADAMQNITGSFAYSSSAGIVMHSAPSGTSTLTGPFYSAGGKKVFGPNVYSHGTNSMGDLLFDASRSVPVANEFRPMNIGMTPAIYLGV